MAQVGWDALEDGRPILTRSPRPSPVQAGTAPRGAALTMTTATPAQTQTLRSTLRSLPHPLAALPALYRELVAVSESDEQRSAYEDLADLCEMMLDCEAYEDLLALVAGKHVAKTLRYHAGRLEDDGEDAGGLVRSAGFFEVQ